MQAYKIVTSLDENLSVWLNSLPIQKNEKIEIIVICSTEKKSRKNPVFSDKDINELSIPVSLPVDPLKFQKNIRNEW